MDNKQIISSLMEQNSIWFPADCLRRPFDSLTRRLTVCCVRHVCVLCPTCLCAVSHMSVWNVVLCSFPFCVTSAGLGAKIGWKCSKSLLFNNGQDLWSFTEAKNKDSSESFGVNIYIWSNNILFKVVQLRQLFLVTWTWTIWCHYIFIMFCIFCNACLIYHEVFFMSPNNGRNVANSRLLDLLLLVPHSWGNRCFLATEKHVR